MIKSILLGILCLLTSAFSSAEEFWVPEYIDVAPGGFSIEKIELGAKATTLYFHYKGKTSDNVGIRKSCFIVDEKGNHYPATKIKGTKFNKHIKLNKQGAASFSISFAPLPAGTEVFDFMEGMGGWNMVQMMMIHKAGTQPTMPSPNQKHIVGITENDFKEDTVWVTGKLTDTDLNRDNIAYYSTIPYPADCYSKWVLENKSGRRLHMNADNTFTMKWIIDGPTIQYLHFNYALVPVLLFPGDHVTVNVSHPGEYNQKITYSGKCAQYSRLLLNMPAIVYNYGARLPEWTDPVLSLDKINKIAANYKQLYEYFTAKYQLSPEEAKLFKAETTLYPAALCLRNINETLSDKKHKAEAPFDLSFLKNIPFENLETSCAPMSLPFRLHLKTFLEKLPFNLPETMQSKDDYYLNEFRSDSVKYACLEHHIGLGNLKYNSFIEQLKLDKLIETGNGYCGWGNLLDNNRDVKLHFMQMKSPYIRTLAMNVLSSLGKPNLESFRLSDNQASRIFKTILKPYYGKYVWMRFMTPQLTKMINVFDSTFVKYEDTQNVKLLAVFNEATCSQSQLDSLKSKYPSLKDCVYLNKDSWYLIRDQYLFSSGETRAFDKQGFMLIGRDFFNSVDDFDRNWKYLKKQEEQIIQCKDDTRLIFQ